MQNRRVAVFVDGGNLYNRLREVAIPAIARLRYRELIESLIKTDTVVSLDYYVGLVKPDTHDPYSIKLSVQQQDFLNFLKSKEQAFTIKLGALVKSGGVYREKGVDVQLAIDMIVGAYENKYDVALLLSSDSDFLPVVKKVRGLGKLVGYVGFSHGPSKALQWGASFYKLLNKEKILPFCPA